MDYAAQGKINEIEPLVGTYNLVTMNLEDLNRLDGGEQIHTRGMIIASANPTRNINPTKVSKFLYRNRIHAHLEGRASSAVHGHSDWNRDLSYHLGAKSLNKSLLKFRKLAKAKLGMYDKHRNLLYKYKISPQAEYDQSQDEEDETFKGSPPRCPFQGCPGMDNITHTLCICTACPALVQIRCNLWESISEIIQEAERQLGARTPASFQEVMVYVLGEIRDLSRGPTRSLTRTAGHGSPSSPQSSLST